MKIKPTVFFGLLAIGFLGLGQASDLEKISRYQAIHANNIEETRREGQGNSAPIQDIEKKSIGEFIDAVYELPSSEKLGLALTYIQKRKLRTDHFLNLVKALQLIEMQPAHVDRLIGVYAVLKKGRFSRENFITFMEMFSKESYLTPQQAENWPFQLINYFSEHEFLSGPQMVSFGKDLKKKGMPPLYIDERLYPNYIHFQGKKLEIRDIKRLLRVLEDEKEVVQRAGIIVGEFLRINAKKLTQPEFREDVEKLQRKVPRSPSLDSVETLSPDARNLLFYSEYEYFKPFWRKNVVISLRGMGGIMRNWSAHLEQNEAKEVAQTFVERNSHRLKEKSITKIKDQFGIE
jgi:hypothetical protein